MRYSETAGAVENFRTFLPLLVCVTGAWVGFANPFFSFPPAVLLFPAALVWAALDAASPRAAFRAGLIGGGLAYAACLYWVAIPVHYYGYIPWVLAVPCPVLLGLFLGLYTGVFCWGVHRFGAEGPIRLGLFAGVLWAVLDVLRGFLLSGFPWIVLPSAFSEWLPAIQSVSVFGAWGLCAVLASASAWGALALRMSGHRMVCLLLAVAVFGLNWGFGALRLDGMESGGQVLKAGIVQANIDQGMKWDAEYQSGTVERYCNLSSKLVREASPDLIVWPETALPFYLQDMSDLGLRVSECARSGNFNLITGAPGYRKGEAQDSYLIFNRAFLLNRRGNSSGWYDKEHLVPFGEYAPFGEYLSVLNSLWEGISDFTPGENSAPLRADSVALGLLICYETIFPELAQKRVEEGAEVLVNISNDAWFGRSSAPKQHLRLSVLRAVEQGRALIRSTNTGISTFIARTGEVGVRSDLFRTQVLHSTVEIHREHTVYHRLFPFVPPALGLACLLLFFVRPRRS